MSDQDELEEEAYYARLCAAAPGEDEDEDEDLAIQSGTAAIESGGGRQRGEPTEQEYFGQEQFQHEDEVVLGEDSLVWQSLLRSAALDSRTGKAPDSMLQEVESSSQRELLSQWLFSHLPSSAACFCRLRTLVLRQVDGVGVAAEEVRCYTDHVQHPSLVLLVSTPLIDSLAIHVHVFSSLPLSPNVAEEICRLLSRLGAGKRLSAVTFAAMDVWTCHDALLPPLLAIGLRQAWIEPVNQWVLADAWPPNASNRFPLPSGYCSRPLCAGDAALVDNLWKYKSEGSLDTVNTLIRTLPCIGICQIETERLVCWCLVDDYGALGKLYTVEEARGRGLARCALARLVDAFLVDGRFRCSPFCYITADNDASSAVFKTLGFEKRRDCEWLGVRL